MKRKEYDGEYVVSPKLNEKIILPTTNKKLTENVRVKEIPYSEVINSGGGETLIIGGE